MLGHVAALSGLAAAGAVAMSQCVLSTGSAGDGRHKSGDVGCKYRLGHCCGVLGGM